MSTEPPRNWLYRQFIESASGFDIVDDDGSLQYYNAVLSRDVGTYRKGDTVQCLAILMEPGELHIHNAGVATVYDISRMALVIGEQIVSQLWPVAWQAFLDYRFNAITLTGPEVSAIQNNSDLQGTQREKQEFGDKLAALGWI